ncbi:hypothetical protein C9J21_06165 [Photobacterium phosphoreum]|uniref:hypothetical protein n=1 Tax=Photobacterium phosphoreum TaxID=659 RepID=UPI000D168F9C|nr:hypothetical protein [Photobacterium phosphoreum]PSW34157.1 hypothetical protein C9J21_06165 [Photobacterium phosphoreum]
MTNHIVTTYTRSIFDDELEDGTIEDFSDESLSVTEVDHEQVDNLAALIGKGKGLADGHYQAISDDVKRVGYRATLDNKDLNTIRFNLVHPTDQESRYLSAYDIEVTAVSESNTLYISIMPHMPFFTTILDMYSGDEAQKIDSAMQQAIDTLAKGWLFKRSMDNSHI